jgi:predicted DNA-binding protein YlxM (UPF0122 family)
MFEKNLKFAYLLDFYGSVLDSHTEAVMRAYYEDDLSLAEVAEGVGISRQGVRHIIKRAEEELERLEDGLGLFKRHEALEDAARRLSDIASRIGKENPELASELADIAEGLTQND